MRTCGGCVGFGVGVAVAVVLPVCGLVVLRGVAARAVLVSGGRAVEVAAMGLDEHALATNAAPEISRREMVCIGEQFTTLR